MAIIHNIDEIRAFIPTFKDLIRCGNFASVESQTPLYAFVVSGSDGITIRTIDAKFILIGLTNVYALVIINDENNINRYCEYMGIPRDITKPISPDSWKWNEDAIGLSFKSDNNSGNFIYFGTDRKDANELKELLKKGLRKETIIYKKLDQDLKNDVIETLKSGKPTKSKISEKRNVESAARKENIEQSQAPVPFFDMSKCLPASIDNKKKEEKEDPIELLYRYARRKYGKEEEHPSQEQLSNKSETIITTDIVYV